MAAESLAVPGRAHLFMMRAFEDALWDGPLDHAERSTTTWSPLRSARDDSTENWMPMEVEVQHRCPRFTLSTPCPWRFCQTHEPKYGT